MPVGAAPEALEPWDATGKETAKKTSREKDREIGDKPKRAQEQDTGRRELGKNVEER